MRSMYLFLAIAGLSIFCASAHAADVYEDEGAWQTAYGSCGDGTCRSAVYDLSTNHTSGESFALNYTHGAATTVRFTSSTILFSLVENGDVVEAFSVSGDGIDTTLPVFWVSTFRFNTVVIETSDGTDFSMIWDTPYFMQFSDQDADGWTTGFGSWTDLDCDDTNASVYPGATELTDTIDNDCDSTVDEGTENFDDDGDGWTEADGDCDDTNSEVNPGVDEDNDPSYSRDGVDNDCDGEIDEWDGYDDTGDTDTAGDTASDTGLVILKGSSGCANGDLTTSGGCSTSGSRFSMIGVWVGLLTLLRRRQA